MASITDLSGTNVLAVDPTYDAARVSLWPQDALGAYRYAGFTGLLPAALAANAEVFQFRWTDASNLCQIKFIKVRMAVITGFTAAQELAFDVIRSTAWSGSGTGGTAIVPSSTNLMRRNTYPISKVGDMRIATTAALGAGTKVLSNTADLVGMGKTLAAAVTVQDAAFENMLDMTNATDDPIILQQNEGFSVRNSIVLGAAGTVRMAVEMGWSEFLNADYPSL